MLSDDWYGDLPQVVAFAFVAIAILGLIFGIWVFIAQMSVFFRYQANNRKHIDGKTARQVAEEMLQKLGYNDISVRCTTRLWLLFFPKWGNRYSPHRKSIFLYRNIIDKSTVTAIAIATQKVGLVMQHKAGEKKMMFRAKWELWTRLAPNLFLPIVLIGAIIDFAINMDKMSNFGYITLAFVGLAIVWTIIAFAALYLVIPTERRAGQLALEAVKKYNLIPNEHMKSVEDLYRVQVRVYINDFILAILGLLESILYLAIIASRFKR